jgi:Protein of unknown function (DUF3617)
MRLVFILLACATTACSQSEPDVDARNASIGEVAEQVREATGEEGFVRPGKWLSQVTLEDVSAPGMPAQIREQMKGMMAKQNSYESCLTPEEAKRPNEDFFAGKDNQCRYEHFTMGDGKIDARMKCAHEGMSQTMEMAGTYSPDSYAMRMTTKTEGMPGPAADMSMKMRVNAKRVGECGARQS